MVDQTIINLLRQEPMNNGNYLTHLPAYFRATGMGTTWVRLVGIRIECFAGSHLENAQDARSKLEGFGFQDCFVTERTQPDDRYWVAGGYLL